MKPLTFVLPGTYPPPPPDSSLLAAFPRVLGPWLNGQSTRLLISRLRVRVPPALFSRDRSSAIRAGDS